MSAAQAGPRPDFSVAKALFLHKLQGGIQARVVLITECNKAKGISAGTNLRRQKFYQSADRTGERIDLGFCNGGAADADRKFGQSAGERNLLQHGRNLMAAQVKTNRLIVGNTHPWGTRLGLRLGIVWHGGIIHVFRGHQKITEAVARNRGRLLSVAMLQTALSVWPCRT